MKGVSTHLHKNDLTNVNTRHVTYVINILLTFVKLMFTIMKERLQRFLELEQLTPARLADILGIQRSGLSHILSGRNKPGFDFIQKMIVKFPALNADWLLTGKGKIYKESTPAPFESRNPIFNTTEGINFEERAKAENRNTYQDIPLSIDNQHQEALINTPELAENSINDNSPTISHKKRSLRKIIFIYSDSTFTEYIPGDE